MGDDRHSHVLVTGGSGFIGRRVVRALLARGAAVTVADKRTFTDDDIETVVGDLRDPSVVERAVRPGTDVVIHLAAVTRVLDSINDPAGTYSTNVAATSYLLEQARKNEVGAFLLASTNAVTGDVGRATITEDIPLRPLTPYGATKAAGEMLDGNQIRDLVHVDDIVAGLFAAWDAKATGPMILGAGESVSVNDILIAARNVTGGELPVTHVPAKPGEMPAVIVDISRARSIGYEPEQDLKSGLATVWPEFAEAMQ
jgi:UDP-glucose 4-epimerase